MVDAGWGNFVFGSPEHRKMPSQTRFFLFAMLYHKVNNFLLNKRRKGASCSKAEKPVFAKKCFMFNRKVGWPWPLRLRGPCNWVGDYLFILKQSIACSGHILIVVHRLLFPLQTIISMSNRTEFCQRWCAPGSKPFIVVSPLPPIEGMGKGVANITF